VRGGDRAQRFVCVTMSMFVCADLRCNLIHKEGRRRKEERQAEREGGRRVRHTHRTT